MYVSRGFSPSELKHVVAFGETTVSVWKWQPLNFVVAKFSVTRSIVVLRHYPRKW